MLLNSSETAIHHFHRKAREKASVMTVLDGLDWSCVERTVKSWMLEKRKGIKVVLTIRFNKMFDTMHM